jgi:carboxyl-terminal processing protease
MLYFGNMTIKRPTFKFGFRSFVNGIAGLFACAVLLGTGGLIGYRLGLYRSEAVPSYIRNSTDPQVGSAQSVNFGVFWQAWNAIDGNFYGNADPSKRLDGAISGMVASLGDPFTEYLPPSENTLFNSQLQGDFGGIGAELNDVNGQLVVESPLSGSPAAKAGILAKDVIIEINGKAVAGMNYDDAIDKIRGPKGSTVTLQIGRAGVDKPFNVVVTRDIITVKSVTTDQIGTGGNIAYIKVNQFGDDTTGLFQAALQQAKDNNAKGVIIDLRDNPGGYLEGAAADIGMVLPSTISSSKSMLAQRIAVIEHFRDGTTQNDPAGTTSILPTTPMVVLVNGGSASAAEIFTGAMRDYGRATIIGTKTYGKGSAQNLIPLSNGGAVKVTVAKWFTPLGIGIDGKGLQPDTVVTLPDGVQTSETDAQVQKALQVLGD